VRKPLVFPATIQDAPMTRRVAFISFLLHILLPPLHLDAQTRALLEPADGRVYHGVQTMTFDAGDPVERYLTALGDSTIQPAVRGLFFSIPGTRGPAASLRQLAGFYAQADSIGFIPELSLFLVSDVATDTVIATSTQYDAIIDSIITLSKAYGRRMFLRIGGEFNGKGDGWNGGGYTPHHYVTMFRKITDMFAARGFRDSVATIWCYYPAAANDFDSVDVRGPLWYPGDAYVDWFGLDLFNADDFDLAAPDSSRSGISRKGKSERFLAMARAHGKPVYMSETSAKGINISADAADGIADWNAWFAKFWEFIAVHPEIKGYSYINANWPDRAYPGWGDARIQNSAYVTEQYRIEMRKPRYIHLPTSSATSAVVDRMRWRATSRSRSRRIPCAAVRRCGSRCRMRSRCACRCTICSGARCACCMLVRRRPAHGGFRWMVRICRRECTFCVSHMFMAARSIPFSSHMSESHGRVHRAAPSLRRLNQRRQAHRRAFRSGQRTSGQLQHRAHDRARGVE
jgi:hypothetical protein